MVNIPIECRYFNDCAGQSSDNCKKCKNNRLRNKETNYFEEAHDNPIPEVNPKVTFVGAIEHTLGYKCPVCGEYTDPYSLGKEKRCERCGFKLNVD